MPTRNANSVAATRLVVPNSSATKIVAAEREVPGNTPATTCAMPTRIATVQLIAVRSPSAFARLAAKCSATTIHTQIGRAHVCTPVTNAQLVCRLLLEKNNQINYQTHYKTQN